MNRLLEEAKTLVRRCVADFGQTISEEEVERVARKVVLAIPAHLRGLTEQRFNARFRRDYENPQRAEHEETGSLGHETQRDIS